MGLSKSEMGQRIKEARAEKGKMRKKKYTQKELAKDINISRSYLGDIESGRTYPNYVLLTKIADACGVQLNFFEEESVKTLKEEQELVEVAVLLNDFVLKFENYPHTDPRKEQIGNEILDLCEKYRNSEIYESLKTRFEEAASLVHAYFPSGEPDIPQISVEEWALINRYRALSPQLQKTVLSLIGTLEEMNKGQEEESAGVS